LYPLALIYYIIKSPSLYHHLQFWERKKSHTTNLMRSKCWSMSILLLPTIFTQTDWWVNTVHHLGSSLMRVQIVFQKVWSGSDETANMLSHSVIVTVVFPRTDSFTYSTFEVGEALENLCSSHYLTYKSYLQHSESLYNIFLQFKSYSNVFCRHSAFLSWPYLSMQNHE
jgi:hypothetical protein